MTLEQTIVDTIKRYPHGVETRELFRDINTHETKVSLSTLRQKLSIMIGEDKLYRPFRGVYKVKERV